MPPRNVSDEANLRLTKPINEAAGVNWRGEPTLDRRRFIVYMDERADLDEPWKSPLARIGERMKAAWLVGGDRWRNEKSEAW
jgi:hypothetical protein